MTTSIPIHIYGGARPLFLPIRAAYFPPLHMSHIILPKLGAKIKCFFFARAIFAAFCALCGGTRALNA